ncbi:hypothetical protein BDZ89DRAFT_1061126 [Hymenopellis radicata]|nr:hypothetical protein BDZ89DRAFT_1061126 [Hymenopellis radicata]
MTATIPSSSVTISVKAINTGSTETALPALAFLSPIPPGNEVYHAPMYAFLLEHPSGKRLLFDLGMRKDESNLAPAVQGLIKLWNDHGLRGLVVDEDVVERLASGGLKTSDIETVIWRLFPSTTELVVGPGSDLKTYPSTPDASLTESDLQGRKVTELKHFTVDIGGYKALDYFSDGSLYILDSPGHCAGHISALVRVTPTSFVLLGGDSCHHSAQIRPNAHSTCPRDMVSVVPNAKANEPLLTLPGPGGPSAYHDREQAIQTIGKLAALDADANILLLLAHDSTLPGVIDEFPKDVNAWKEKGWKDKLMWAFMDKNSPAYRFEAK